MSDQNEDMNERLRKAREKAKKTLEAQAARKANKPILPEFVQYGTMFKLESRPVDVMTNNCHPRLLECVNCGLSLDWRIYTVAPEKFDDHCPECNTTARDHWKGKLHKELDPDA